MPNFDTLSAAFDQDARRPAALQERADVFTVIAAAAQPVRGSRRFAEPDAGAPMEAGEQLDRPGRRAIPPRA